MTGVWVLSKGSSSVLAFYKWSVESSRRLTCNRSPFLSHVITGGGTASDLHSNVTCLFLNTVKSWGSSIPAILGGTKHGNRISRAFDKLGVNDLSVFTNKLGFLYDKSHELQLLVIQFMVRIISKLDHYYLALLSIK